MPRTSFFLFAVLCLVSIETFAQDPAQSLLFKKPASNFTESLPIGNGRLGAMIFGDPTRDRIILNEKSLWSGGVQDADREDAFQYLEPIQSLLLQGKNQEAQELLQQNFVSKGVGSGYGTGANEHYGAYQTLGDLWITWQDTLGEFSKYKRVLDLENAISSVSWERNGNQYIQEAFSSIPDQVMVIRLSSTKKNGLNFHLAIERKEHAEINVIGSTQLKMMGQLPNKDQGGMKFASIVRVISNDGKVSASGSKIQVENSSECYLILAAATDYNISNPSLRAENPLEKVEKTLDNFDLESAKEKHILAYQAWYKRNSFQMGDSFSALDKLSTPERLERYSKGESDPQLPVLYYNYGKYLLISSSQPGELPTNLQGIWAQEYQTPWNGDYHLNINVQMNYWHAEAVGLGALTMPLHDFTKSLVENGSKTARAYYNAPGWVAHVISNPWRYTSPGEGANWGSTMTGGAWLTEHIWEHFRFTGDTTFLREYYPVLKGASEFLAAVLIKEPKNGYFVTAPSNSPENSYRMPDGFSGFTTMGPTIDMQIARELFGNTIQAAEILGLDSGLVKELDEKRRNLAPNTIGAKGDLNEWLEDWEDAEPQHRHVSHLYGLHPYDEITPWDSPDLAQAVRETLAQRGDGGTGWSRAWKINFWARLGDGDHALVLLKKLLEPVWDSGDKIVMSNGGTYANLFCAHPPFQIDGNFGGAAGISEMLFQSHGEDETIRLLSALPQDQDWQKGELTGMRARGGFIVDFVWENGKVQEGQLISKLGKPCSFLLPEGMKIMDSSEEVLAENLSSEAQLVTFETEKSGNYFLQKIEYQEN
ncbi:glycoside hydrolase family 95 protein [Algoriphagus vanfongensis]|uniref:glycoside hydrolase family 95 protein n=1 Tax=Algoriphagus vanfongensis TaxID=426371 RepID=UPI00040E3B90|nr:glycoside hydrolase family 95 protein [Algoriphagus vanfongensis]